MKNPGKILTSSIFSIKWPVLPLIFLATFLNAQQPPAGAPAGRGQANIGRFYGKVVDENGKGVGYATVQLFGKRFDRATRSLKDTLLAGQITLDNGDFSLENLPVMGDFTLKISFIGYAEIEKQVTFGIPMPQPGAQPGAPPAGPPAGGPPANGAGMSGRFDKDLGNIPLVAESSVLQEVVVTGEATAAVLALDRKVYRVDKNAMAAGGNATDALRNIPSLSVDIDGNVSMRNTSPQIFIDGRPSTLTLDQIAADAIESVEVITNPSAKYDASGGQAGIINIVLKKERRIGYNGNLRLGADTNGGINAGGDINAREGKINGFLSANFNQRRSRGEGTTDRRNFFGEPVTDVLQVSDNEMNGLFAMMRGGIDWFMDNRNTLTLTGSFVRGRFKPEEVIDIHIDSLYDNGITSSDALRTSLNERNFRNAGASLLFKHLFPKTGKELTADLNYNRMSNDMEGNFLNQSLDSGLESREQQLGGGNSNFFTAQADYAEPINENMKVEAGARAMIRHFYNENFFSYFDQTSGGWVPVPTFADRYGFDDAVYAAYATLSHEIGKWGYQAGLRVESSQYTGELPGSGESFTNDYPLSLFPSLFITRKLNEEDNIQASYTRRVNRPNFFQLMPFTDVSDPLNLRRGNPDLLPEFTTSLEMSYQNIFSKGHNLLVTAYFKQTDDLITSYQYSEYSPALERNVLVNSYANSNSSQAYGVEFTLKNIFLKNFELTSNVNLYNSKVDASNVEAGLVNEQFSWFLKENLAIKLPASFSLQISGEYFSPAAFTPSSGGGRFGGGPWGGPTNTAQGYSIENWFVDVAVRKDLFNRKATLTLSMQDIFRSRQSGSYTESDFFIQDTWRVRDQQLVRANFSYRFGKMDASLFKRKNTRDNSQGVDMMQ